MVQKTAHERNGRLSDKEKARELMEKLNCTYEVTRADYPYNEMMIEVSAPKGFNFNGELHILCCSSWKDVIERLSDRHMTLEEDMECSV